MVLAPLARAVSLLTSSGARGFAPGGEASADGDELTREYGLLLLVGEGAVEGGLHHAGFVDVSGCDEFACRVVVFAGSACDLERAGQLFLSAGLRGERDA